MAEPVNFDDLQAVDFDSLEEPSNFAPVATENVARGLVDTVLNTPRAVGDLAGGALAGSAALLSTFGESFGAAAADSNLRSQGTTPVPFSFGDAFDRNNAKARATFPASLLLSGPSPTSFDVEALVRTVPEALRQSPLGTTVMGDNIAAFQMQMMLNDLIEESNIPPVSEQFSNTRDEITEGFLDRRESNPAAAQTGDVVTDAASLALTRAPFASAARANRLTRGAVPDARATRPLDPGFKGWIDRQVQKHVIPALKGAGLRVGEAGLEGAYIAAINDNDPLTAAAFGASAEAVGTASRLPFKPKTLGGKLAVSALAAFTFIEISKQITPVDDGVIDSAESAYDKAIGMLILGAASSAAGFGGRPTQQQRDHLGALIDSWSSMRRGAANSLFQDLASDSDGKIEAVLGRFMEDPDAFGPTAKRRIGRALDGNVSLLEVIEGLEADLGFKSQLNAILEQQ